MMVAGQQVALGREHERRTVTVLVFEPMVRGVAFLRVEPSHSRHFWKRSCPQFRALGQGAGHVLANQARSSPGR
jgi:hypothetical protein